MEEDRTFAESFCGMALMRMGLERAGLSGGQSSGFWGFVRVLDEMNRLNSSMWMASVSSSMPAPDSHAFHLPKSLPQ